MSSLKKRKRLLETVRGLRKITNPLFKKKDIPDLFTKCKYCNNTIDQKKLYENFFVCPKCGEHLPMRAEHRFEQLLDRGYKILDFKLEHINPIDFEDYDEKINELQQKTGLKEAIVSAYGSIDRQKLIVSVLQSEFLMGSMGSYLGEYLTKSFEFAMNKRVPILVISASGGARMQEGIFSLMQMAKTAAIVEKFSERKLLYISLLTHPTTGGVSASFASLGDIIIAEPNALIGFAGPRVIEQTIKQKLPEGFQRAEKLIECGFLDIISDRFNQRKLLLDILKLHS